MCSQFVSETNDIKFFITIVYTQLCMKVVNAEYINFLFPSFQMTLVGFHTVAFRSFSIVVGENSFVCFRLVGNMCYG